MSMKFDNINDGAAFRRTDLSSELRSEYGRNINEDEFKEITSQFKGVELDWEKISDGERTVSTSVFSQKLFNEMDGDGNGRVREREFDRAQEAPDGTIEGSYDHLNRRRRGFLQRAEAQREAVPRP